MPPPAPTRKIYAGLRSSDADDVVTIWECATGRAIRRLHVSIGSDGGDLCWSPDNRLLCIDESGKGLRMWDIQSTRTVRVIPAAGREFRCPQFSPDGSLIAVAVRDNPVMLFDVATGSEVAQLETTLSPWLLRFSPKGSLLAMAASGRGPHEMWDVEQRKIAFTFPKTSVLAFSPDGELFAGAGGQFSGTKDRLWVRNAHTGETIYAFECESEFTREFLAGDYGLAWTSTLAFSPDGRELTVGYWRSMLAVWDLETNKLTRSVWGLGGGRMDDPTLQHSHEGKTLCWGDRSEKDLFFCYEASPTLISKFRKRYSSWPQISPDGKLALQSKYSILDMPTGEPKARISLNDIDIWDSSWSPDSRFLACKCRDVVTILDAQTCNVVSQFG